MVLNDPQGSSHSWVKRSQNPVPFPSGDHKQHTPSPPLALHIILSGFIVACMNYFTCLKSSAISRRCLANPKAGLGKVRGQVYVWNSKWGARDGFWLCMGYNCHHCKKSVMIIKEIHQIVKSTGQKVNGSRGKTCQLKTQEWYFATSNVQSFTLELRHFMCRSPISVEEKIKDTLSTLSDTVQVHIIQCYI